MPLLQEGDTTDKQGRLIGTSGWFYTMLYLNMCIHIISVCVPWLNVHTTKMLTISMVSTKFVNYIDLLFSITILVLFNGLPNVVWVWLIKLSYFSHILLWNPCTVLFVALVSSFSSYLYPLNPTSFLFLSDTVPPVQTQFVEQFYIVLLTTGLRGQ